MNTIDQRYSISPAPMASAPAAAAQIGPLELTVFRRPGPLLMRGGAWDQLLERSPYNTVFMHSGWLRSAWAAYGENARLYIPAIFRGNALIAAAAFIEEEGILRFLGHGPGDYLDFLLDPALSEFHAQQCIEQLLSMAQHATTGFRAFHLQNLREELGTPNRLLRLQGGLYPLVLRTGPAPAMHMSAAAKALKKQSLKRSENKLKKAGTLTSATYTESSDILPRLPGLFQQHIDRWSDSGTPSMFLEHQHQDFFNYVVQELGPTGCLRYTEVRLDDRLIAAHLGSHHAGRFTWYKPTYDVSLAKYSPGEVLLKRLIEQARDEGAEEFDFTLGGEGFKLRYATVQRRMFDMMLTPRRWHGRGLKSYLALKTGLREHLEPLGVWEKLRAAKLKIKPQPT